MGNLRGGDREARMVVDRAGADRALCVGVDLAFLCGTQQTSDVWASTVVVAGGSEDGRNDAGGQNERRGQTPEWRLLIRDWRRTTTFLIRSESPGFVCLG